MRFFILWYITIVTAFLRPKQVLEEQLVPCLGNDSIKCLINYSNYHIRVYIRDDRMYDEERTDNKLFECIKTLNDSAPVGVADGPVEALYGIYNIGDNLGYCDDIDSEEEDTATSTFSVTGTSVEAASEPTQVFNHTADGVTSTAGLQKRSIAYVSLYNALAQLIASSQVATGSELQ